MRMKNFIEISGCQERADGTINRPLRPERVILLDAAVQTWDPI